MGLGSINLAYAMAWLDMLEPGLILLVDCVNLWNVSVSSFPFASYFKMPVEVYET